MFVQSMSGKAKIGRIEKPEVYLSVQEQQKCPREIQTFLSIRRLFNERVNRYGTRTASVGVRTKLSCNCKSRDGTVTRLTIRYAKLRKLGRPMRQKHASVRA